MTLNNTRGAIRIAGPGHAAFAVTMIALGILGLIKRDFTVVWQPVPNGVPARELLIYFCAVVSLVSGIGLLWRRTAVLAAAALLASLCVWFLLWRVRLLFTASFVESTWSCGQIMVMAAAAWILFASFAMDARRPDLGFVAGAKGVSIGRALYGLGLIPFGIAHFIYLKQTVALVPGWLPGQVAWAYLTGATFIIAGVAIVVGLFARLAATLSALQMGMFALLVWIPRVATGSVNAFQMGEFITTLALTAAGWVVADSYRTQPWLSPRNR